MREAFRLHPDVSPRPLDIVMIAKRDVEDFSFQGIEGEYLHVVSRFLSEPSPPKGHARGRRGRGRKRGRSSGGGGGPATRSGGRR